MGNYNDRDSGGSRGRGRGGRDDGQKDRMMYKAACDRCNDRCMVPFKPSRGKQVLCSDCFGTDRRKENGSDGRDRMRDSRRDSERPRRNMSDGRSEHYELEFKKLNDKLDRILKRITPAHNRGPKKATEESLAETPEDTPETEDKK